MTKDRRDDIVSAIVDILSPLTHAERDAVLIELLRYRAHWFEHANIHKGRF